MSGLRCLHLGFVCHCLKEEGRAEAARGQEAPGSPGEGSESRWDLLGVAVGVSMGTPWREEAPAGNSRGKGTDAPADRLRGGPSYAF